MTHGLRPRCACGAAVAELDGEHGPAVLRSTLTDSVRPSGNRRCRSMGMRWHARLRRSGGRRTVPRLAGAGRAHNDPLSRLCDDCLAALSEAVTFAGPTSWPASRSQMPSSLTPGRPSRPKACGWSWPARWRSWRRGWRAAGLHRGPRSTRARWLALDPLHEPAHRLIMQLHAWDGDRAAAVRQYRECVKVLQEELGVEPEPETTALFEAIRGGTAAGQSSPALPLSRSPTPAHNLPPDPTPFIGRETELAQVAAHLADPDCRLLTILGPGGIGKTRLAVQAAQAAAERFTHGACFVDLAPIASAELLAATILRALQAPSYGAAEPDQHILDYLAGKQMLLVLDNYEQLLTGWTGSARRLRSRHEDAGAAPQIKLLVTSRARLNVRAEWLAPLEGLEVPGDPVTKARR